MMGVKVSITEVVILNLETVFRHKGGFWKLNRPWRRQPHSLVALLKVS